MQVMVVEDDPLIRLGMVGLVEDWGFEVIEAQSADEALKLLDRPNEVGLVITDVDMPGSMDGLRLSHAIRLRWPPIPIIVVSGKAAITPDRLPERAMFFSKPVRDSVLQAAARRLLSGEQRA